MRIWSISATCRWTKDLSKQDRVAEFVRQIKDPFIIFDVGNLWLPLGSPRTAPRWKNACKNYRLKRLKAERMTCNRRQGVNMGVGKELNMTLPDHF